MTALEWGIEMDAVRVYGGILRARIKLFFEEKRQSQRQYRLYATYSRNKRKQLIFLPTVLVVNLTCPNYHRAHLTPILPLSATSLSLRHSQRNFEPPPIPQLHSDLAYPGYHSIDPAANIAQTPKRRTYSMYRLSHSIEDEPHSHDDINVKRNLQYQHTEISKLHKTGW